MLQKMRGNAGLSLVELLVICAIILIVAAIAFPGFLSSQRASNERGASTQLKTLVSAEADFRANDRDKNKVNDFWTADVKGLYTMTPAAELEKGDLPKHLPLQLIDRSVAAADGDDTFYPAGGENLPLSQFAVPGTTVGYWYMALLKDLTLKDAPEGLYKTDTGGSPPMGKVHNTSKFGFAAFPDRSSAGKYVFRVNENNTIFRFEIEGEQRTGTTHPPGFRNVPAKFLEWPNDDDLKKIWSPID
jgi:type II secretory pathway pseudopilin PulG